jgi:hypothetical protein
MFNKEANNNLGLCPVKGQNSALCSLTGDRNQFSSLYVGADKTLCRYTFLPYV